MMKMINLLILPIILPFLFAILLLFFKNHIRVQRFLTLLGLAVSLVAALCLMWKVKTVGVQTVTLGSWPAPFGITLVADMLSALLVTTSIIISICVVMYSFTAIGEARERFYYYSAVLFMFKGIYCAFTIGVIFFLFVLFLLFLIGFSFYFFIC